MAKRSTRSPSARSAPRSASTDGLPERAPWLPGFGWAVPTAFSAAVSACRFEQGDVLYAKRSAYDDWAEGPPRDWIQVLDPPRSARARGADADAGRFGSSWASPVTVEIGRDGASTATLCVTTQGRLFTTLWKADLDALEASPAPTPPRLLAELQRSLDAALAGMRAALLVDREGAAARTAPGQSDGASALLFMTGVDLASDASRAKAEAIWTALAAGHRLRLHDASPAACGVPDGAAYHPSLVVRGIAIEAEDGGPAQEARVTEALKAVLYNPSSGGSRSGDADPDEVASEAGKAGKADEAGKAGKAEAPARADRFSLARHGWLGPLVAADGPDVEDDSPAEPGGPAKSRRKT